MEYKPIERKEKIAVAGNIPLEGEYHIGQSYECACDCSCVCDCACFCSCFEMSPNELGESLTKNLTDKLVLA